MMYRSHSQSTYREAWEIFPEDLTHVPKPTGCLFATPNEIAIRESLGWADALFEQCDHERWLSTYHVYVACERARFNQLVNEIGVLPERGFGLWEAARVLAGLPLTGGGWAWSNQHAKKWEAMATLAAYLESHDVRARVGFGAPPGFSVNGHILLCGEQTRSRSECERIADLVEAVPAWLDRKPQTISRETEAPRWFYR